MSGIWTFVDHCHERIDNSLESSLSGEGVIRGLNSGLIAKSNVEDRLVVELINLGVVSNCSLLGIFISSERSGRVEKLGDLSGVIHPAHNRIGHLRITDSLFRGTIWSTGGSCCADRRCLAGNLAT